MEPQRGPFSSLDVRGDVLFGSNDELYLAGGRHSILGFATGENKIAQRSIDNLAANLKTRQAFCDARSIPYAHLVAPEKWVVQSDEFPLRDPVPMARHYFDQGCRFTYPVDRLKAPRFGRAYYKTDTHWNASGVWTVAEIIAKVAGLSDDAIAERAEEARKVLVPEPAIFFGDLGRKLTPQQGEPRDRLSPPHGVFTHENGMGHDVTSPVNDGRMIITLSGHRKAAGTLLIFGDSYLHHALASLSWFFRTSVFCRTRFFHEELVDAIKPSVIITQQAERYLSNVSRDTEAPPFLMLPALMGRAAMPSRESAEVIARVLSSGRQINCDLFRRPTK